MKKKTLLLSIILVLVALISGTMAWVTFRSKKTAMVLTIGSADNMMITITPYQKNEVIYPVSLAADAPDPFVATVTNNTSESKVFGFYFKLNSIDSELLSSTFKYYTMRSTDGTSWQSMNNGLGSFTNALNSNRMYFFEDSVPSGDIYYYKIYIYIDANDNNNNLASGMADIELRADIEDTGNYVKVLTNDNDDLIYKLHHDAIAASSSITGSIIPATDDYRYYGIDPNNYICLDYDGESTCPDKHLYRIIGIIRNDYTGDNELKLIKANSLVNDSNGTTFAFGTTNAWNTSTLNTTTFPAYYNSTSSFVNNGLSSVAKDLVSTSKYYLGGASTIARNSANMYLMERGTTYLSGFATANSKIALIYPSDYGYASLRAASYDGLCDYRANCSISNWMVKDERTMMPNTGTTNTIYGIGSDGSTTSFTVSTATTVHPVLSIRSDVIISGGLGTLNNPYKIEGPTSELYDVLKFASYGSNPYAKRYVGNHQDDFNGTRSTEEIYHWYASDSTSGVAITDKFNVLFANMCWQMIRTTDTGGVRLLYNGLPTISSNGGVDSYYCGPGRISNYYDPDNDILYFDGTDYYFSNNYTYTENGNTASFTLVNPIQVVFNSGDYDEYGTLIEDIIANYPYTCYSSNPSGSCDTLYKVVERGELVDDDAYAYKSVDADSIAVSSFNSSNNIRGMSYVEGDVYLFYNKNMSQVSNTVLSTVSNANLTTYGNYYFGTGYTMSGNNHRLSSYTRGSGISGYPQSWEGRYTCGSTSTSCSTLYYITKVVTNGSTTTIYRVPLSSGKQYNDLKFLIGDSISDNGDGTFNLTGNVQEIEPSNMYSTWNANYSSYSNKWVCLYGYYTISAGGTPVYTCGSTSTDNDIKAIGKITSVSSTAFVYKLMYKFGNGIELDSGNVYRLISDGSTVGTLQYIYNWSNSSSSSSTPVGGIATTGYASIGKSHYTCYNLSGKCSNYYYVYYTSNTYSYDVRITGGKYVSTSNVTTDTNNVIYNILYKNGTGSSYDSTIKKLVDEWYANNLYVDYDAYVDDTVYCSNKSIASFGGWDPNLSPVSSLTFASPSLYGLGCPNTLDQYSHSNSSAYLQYKVALMSESELELLGAYEVRASNDSYWLMTPAHANNLGYNYQMSASGVGNPLQIIARAGVRPTISLISGLEYSRGTGAKDDPYVVDAQSTNK